MKRFFLASALALGSLAVAEEPKSQEVMQMVQETECQSGRSVVESTLRSYQENAYSPLLNELQRRCELKLKENQYKEILEQKKTLSKENFTKKISNLYGNIQSLQNEASKKLFKIAQQKPSHPLSRSIKNVIFFSLSDDQMHALEMIHSQIENRQTGEGKTPLQNELIHLANQRELMQLELDQYFCELHELDSLQHKKATIALKWQTAQKMKAKAMEHSNDPLASAVLTYTAIFPLITAQQWDQQLLFSLEKGKRHPSSEYEELVRNELLSVQSGHEQLIVDEYTFESSSTPDLEIQSQE